MAQRTKARHVGRAVQVHQDRKAWGDEPAPTNKELTQIELGKALTWYNYMCDRADARAYLESYLKSSGDGRAAAIKRASDKAIVPTAGWIARLLTRGFILPESTMVTFDRLINESGKIIIADDEEETPEKKIVEPPKVSVFQRTMEKAGDLIADVEDVVDAWRDNPTFSMYELLSKNQIAPKIASEVSRYYRPLLDELELVLKEKDVGEAYGYMGRKERTNYIAFIKRIIDECDRYTNVTKKAVIRKPRKVKSQTPEKKLAKLKFMKEFAELQIKSVNPASALGATELWVFDTKYNRLTILKSDKGLDIKGTTVIGFDPNKSQAKVIGRKAKEIVAAVLSGTKTSAHKSFDKVNTKAGEANGRINENSILLRVFK